MKKNDCVQGRHLAYVDAAATPHDLQRCVNDASRKGQGWGVVIGRSNSDMLSPYLALWNWPELAGISPGARVC
jgi:hypothetical protein